VTVRLPTHLEVAGWRRAVEAGGGFAAILAKGDPDVGSVLLLTIERGGNPRLWERMPQRDGSRIFTPIGVQSIDNKQDFSEYLARRRAQDPDLWIVELDVPKPERFVDLRSG
jgi:hypothetical protein